MLKLLRSRRTRPATAPLTAPDTAGGVIYAIGDVHGRHDLLDRLLDRIVAEANLLDAPPTVVFLGDYIDRGDGARETLDLLISAADWPEVETVFLMGNHEQMLLRFLRDPATGAHWLRFGGLQTLLSYGIGGAPKLRAEGAAERLQTELAEALGPHLGFIEGLLPSHRAGNLLFAHAGADPSLPPGEQEVATLLWGCKSFLNTGRSDGIWVVHGHIVVDQPTAEHGRIALDTGAYFSGKLTAARIAGGEVTFFQA